MLRHQLNVLNRSLHGRVRLTNNDRWFFIQLYRWVPSILQVLTIIRSDQNRPTLHAEFNGIGGPRTYIGMVLVPPPALLSFGPSFQPPLGPILTRRVKMIDAVTAILGLFSAGIFVAHTVDAYRAPKPTAVSRPAPGR